MQQKTNINPEKIYFYGAPGGSRTHDLRLRRPTLYPAELQAHSISDCGLDIFHDFIPQSAIRNSQFLGAPGRARTCGIRIRSPTLYPAELRALVKPLKL